MKHDTRLRYRLGNLICRIVGHKRYRVGKFDVCRRCDLAMKADA